MAVDRELSQSDRRRSSKCRYLHLQIAGRSHVLSGSGGTSADSRRKFVSNRAASHASSGAMTSAPRYFSLGLPSTMTTYLVERWARAGVRVNHGSVALRQVRAVGAATRGSTRSSYSRPRY